MTWPFVRLLSVCFILSALSPQIFGDDSDNANSESWPLSVLEGLRIVHCQDDYSRKVFERDEQTQLNWLATQNHCFGDENNFLRQLQKKINEWNEKLSTFKREKVLKSPEGQVKSFKCMKDRKYWQSRLLNAIWMIFRAQNITISQYFLEKFLNNIEDNKVGMGKVIRTLEKQGKVFDMTRYEKKREANEADLESIKVQLEEKFNNFKDKVNHPKKPEKEYAIDFSMEEHLDILNNIKTELAKVQLKWPSNKEKESEANKVKLERTSTGESKANKVQLERTSTGESKAELEWTPTESEADQFWTIDQRPVVRQTLWIIRHAEREDNINEEWKKGLSKLEQEDSPLSERGIRQAEELGKWFGKINVDRVYASPFIRCLETANGLIGGKNYPRGSIQQGTDQRGSDQKESDQKKSDQTAKGKDQKEKGSDQKGKGSDQKGSDQKEWIDQRGIFINCEPGLAEFYGQSNIKFGFKPCQSQKTFPIDSNYSPLFNGDLLQMMEMERKQRDRSADDHDFVTVQTIRHILENNKEAENIVFVTHMQNSGLLLELMGAEWAAVGQATISKLVKYEENVGIGKQSDVLQQFRLEYASGVTHLTERKDLRPR
ncbi:hypothetical protein niasHT_008868 [Heterodera trifolii]|uniref:Uncharacterized protein n=1 Tax=Heterodera trifolii TaxID=157864 RepID=A0ABD2LYD6_9BILA